MKFPSIKAIRAELVGINHNVEDECPVRLQVWEDSQWRVHYGDPGYDQDHRGFWGASEVPGSSKRFNATEMAKDLLSQAKDAYADSIVMQEMVS